MHIHHGVYLNPTYTNSAVDADICEKQEASPCQNCTQNSHLSTKELAETVALEAVQQTAKDEWTKPCIVHLYFNKQMVS